MVNHWEAFIRDSGRYDEDYSARSGDIYSSKIIWTFDGLVSGTKYYVWFKIVTNVGQIYMSPPTPFEVRYTDVSVGMLPTATNDEDNANILVQWAPLIENIGSINGEYSFIDYLAKPNKGLYLHRGSSLTYDDLKVKDGNSSVPMFIWTPRNENFNGTIMKAENSKNGTYLEIGYDDSLKCFWYSVDGGNHICNAMQIIYPSMAYMIGMSKDGLIVNVVGNVEVNWPNE